MDIPTFEVKLPVTGCTVVLYKYLTIGQSRELQKILLASGTFNTETSKFENLNTETFLVMQDKAAVLLIKEYKDANGVVQPFSAEWLSGLPMEDGTLIYDELNKITGSSTKPREDKKN